MTLCKTSIASYAEARPFCGLWILLRRLHLTPGLAKSDILRSLPLSMPADEAWKEILGCDAGHCGPASGLIATSFLNSLTGIRSYSIDSLQDFLGHLCEGQQQCLKESVDKSSQSLRRHFPRLPHTALLWNSISALGWPPLRVVKHQSRCGCDCRLFPKGLDLVCFVRCRWYCQWTLVSSFKLGNLVFTHALKGLVWRCRHVRSICRVRSYSRPVYQPPRSVSDDGNDKRRMIDDIYTFPWTTKS